MEHIHGPNCGCKDYIGVENADDLFSSIDIEKVRCLNQKYANSGKKVFKEYENRYDKEGFATSASDGEFLLIIPFIAQVKIRSICVIGKDQNVSPAQMRLYINTENVDFSLTETAPVEQFPLFPNLDGAIHNAVKPSKFIRVHKLLIHFINPNIQQMSISYIQIKGQNSNIKRQAVTAVYEIQPNAKKNELKDMQKNSFQMG